MPTFFSFSQSIRTFYWFSGSCVTKARKCQIRLHVNVLCKTTCMMSVGLTIIAQRHLVLLDNNIGFRNCVNILQDMFMYFASISPVLFSSDWVFFSVRCRAFVDSMFQKDVARSSLIFSFFLPQSWVMMGSDLQISAQFAHRPGNPERACTPGQNLEFATLAALGVYHLRSICNIFSCSVSNLSHSNSQNKYVASTGTAALIMYIIKNLTLDTTIIVPSVEQRDSRSQLRIFRAQLSNLSQKVLFWLKSFFLAIPDRYNKKLLGKADQNLSTLPSALTIGICEVNSSNPI